MTPVDTDRPKRAPHSPAATGTAPKHAPKPSDEPVVVGVDLGGTKILAGVIGAKNAILGRSKRPTPAREGADAILKTIIECVDEALEAAQIERGAIAAIGVGSPGPLDSTTGVILYSANLNVKNFALGGGLATEYGRPTAVRNDVWVGGYAEFRLGAGVGKKNILTAFVGTGIGGCLVVDGRVVEGAHGNVGEVGHVVVKAGGPKCGCGSHGCVEVYSSKTAIGRRIQKAIRKGVPTTLAEKLTKKSGKLKSGDLAAAFTAGDHVAIKEVHRAAHYLGLAMGGMVNVFGPELVVLGGGVTEALGAPWIELVHASAKIQILTRDSVNIPFVAAALGDDAGMLGAALVAREIVAK